MQGQQKKCQINIILYEKEYHTLKSPETRPIMFMQKKRLQIMKTKKIREIFEEFDDEDGGNKTIH